LTGCSPPGGPLVEIVDVPNLQWTPDDPVTLRLICLAASGRAHYAGHWAAYRELYPDVVAPPPDPVTDGGQQR
jgi:hypothetical protein